ncbi:MAG: hypothetical protein WDZ69_02190 [Candidatus Pacearchaeota archaeon]
MGKFRVSDFNLIEFPSEKIGLEVCVSCGEGTSVNKITHIRDRDYYVEGAGQLHKECYEEIYGGSLFEERQEFMEKVRSMNKGELVHFVPEFTKVGISDYKGGLN